MAARLELKLRRHQLAAYRTETRFEVRVWHRRAGKTYYTLGRQLARALTTGRKDWRAYYLAPNRVQAKAIAWDYLKRWVSPLQLEINESELRVELPGGARMQLLGAESYDSLRGRYADDLALDETAHIPGVAWTTILSPMLADRRGRATFMGTPNGRMNLLHTLHRHALEAGDPEWSTSVLTYRDTDVLAEGEVMRMRRTMSEAEFAQELECSWDAALPGAFYARELADIEAQGRVASVRYDPELPVIAALDLGHNDLMPVIWMQPAGTEKRIIGCRAYQFTSIPDMVRSWRDLPWPTDRVVLPHDAGVREIGSGKTRTEVFIALGCDPVIAPRQSVMEGIEAVRRLLRHAVFDAQETVTLREALSSYRSEYDEVRGVHRVTPVHDWSSHYADAMRYLATGEPQDAGHWGPRDMGDMGIYA